MAERWSLQAVYTSPLTRAKQTARVIAEAQDLQAQPFEGQLDIDFGDWQGRSPDDVRNKNPDLLQRWYEAPHTVEFPGGESLDDVRHRAVGGLDAVLDLHRGRAVAMVGHSVVNRVLLCAVLGLSNEHFWQLRQDTCAVNVFEVDEDGNRTVVSLNDTCHLRNVGE